MESSDGESLVPRGILVRFPANLSVIVEQAEHTSKMVHVDKRMGQALLFVSVGDGI